MIFTDREFHEIYLAIYYYELLHHGTSGHNEKMLLGKLAIANGFSIDAAKGQLYYDTQTVLDLLSNENVGIL